MALPIARLRLGCMIIGLLALAGCGGGGGGDSLVAGDAVSAQQSQPVSTFETDIEPIMQAKCLGCHNDGDNPVAPFSLVGRDKAQTFKSSILYTLESNTMPPPGTPQLTGSERARLMAWASDQPYDYVPEILRISLVEATAWATQPKNRDSFLSYRPDEVTCKEGEGWLVEGDELEVRTEFCNYLSVSQNSLLELAAGTEIELALSHSALDYNAPSEAHLGLAIGGSPVWETTVAIPSDSAILKPKIVLPFAISRGDSIEFQVSNHGNNTYTFYDLIAVVSSDTDLTECVSFDSTFEAIQETVYEQGGCANSLCHAGTDPAGGLDLSPDVAWANLVDVQAQGSSDLLVDPRNPDSSYLYKKLAAKTFPGSYDIAGAPMPSAGAAITAGQLEAHRLWIEAGSPEFGSVGDTLGRGEDEIERLLGVCLPEAEAVNTVPLPAPAPDKGIQFVMPAQDVPAESEREVCFAVYKDFRNDIPEEFLSEDRETFYTAGGETREDAFTHHNLIYKAPVGIEALDDPSFGKWICGGGEQDGDSCDPRDITSCGAGGPSPGQCHAQMRDSIACRGYGPEGVAGGQGTLGLGAGIEREGFYSEYPSHGVFYWNSHAFNLTTEDGTLRVWRNINFATDRRFAAKGINDISDIFIATGVPPFEKRTLCSDYIFAQGDGLLAITSHTHKRGERFFMEIQGEELYETFTYDEPLYKTFEPAMVFNSPDPKARTLTHCATYNNGVNADGSLNTETVVRLSRRPVNARSCRPTACVAGDIGASCNGPDDDASCNASPGSGACDACAISGAFSSDDEMFILIGSKLPDHDMQMNAYMHRQAEVIMTAPERIFNAGDVVDLQFTFTHFALEPPEDHGHGGMDGGMDDDMMDHDSGHGDSGGDHAGVNAGHYHVYFDTDDDSADHVTAWSPTVEFPLPMDASPGTYEMRVSLRAPDHHAIGVEHSVWITVQ
jgi:hypothetical protein